MKKIFSSPQYDEAGILQSVLEQQGIECVMLDECESRANAGIPCISNYIELWIVQDSIYEKARLIVDEWLSCKK